MAARITRAAAQRSGRRGTGTGEGGFTLLELLVVVSVVSVLVTVAALGVGIGGPTRADDAARLSGLFDRGRHLAVAEGRVVGLLLTAGGAQLMRRDGSGWTAEAPAVTWDGVPDIASDQMVFIWPSDQSDPLQVEFRLQGGGSIRCVGTGVGGVACSG